MRHASPITASQHLTRASLARVVQSLLTAELRVARGRRGQTRDLPGHLTGAWSEEVPIADGNAGLGCDSLDVMWLASAANEMFNLHESRSGGDPLAGKTFGSWLDDIETAWRSGVEHCTFTTSGTSGRPKRCTHAFDHLRIEVDALAAHWADRRRVLGMVPAHHIYGFIFTALLPDRLGVEVVDADRFGPGRLAQSIGAGDLLVSFPDRWAWIERSLPSWPDDVEGVVSTAPCPGDLIEALRSGGLSRMTEVYGSSETSGVALRVAPEQSYRLMPQWSFDEPFDPENPVLVHRSGGRHSLMDRVERVDDALFLLAGRRDDMVQVGGTNVSPEEVAAKLRRRPGVADAVVRLMRPDEGTRLKAFIVPARDVRPATLLTALKTWIAANLSTCEQPKEITFGKQLPKGPIGKAADW